VLLFAAIVWHLDRLIFIGLAVFGTYCGIMFPSTIYAGMQALPVKQKGVGMGIFFSGSFLCATLGITIASHLVLWVPSMPERFMILIAIMAAMTVLALWLQTRQKLIRSN
jgi:MFS family permease